jgi:GT2 family glycosyltransferase
MTDAPKRGNVAVVVVSYNTRELLRACLRSVPMADSAGIVVVDSGSSDGSVDMVRSEFPSVRTLDVPNRGYGAAANAGFRATRSEHVLLLNSDTVLSPGSIRALGRHLDTHLGVAVVGPRLLNPDGSLQRSCFPFPTPGTVLLGETRLGALIHLVPVLRDRHPRTWRHDRVRPMPWVLGAALAIRRSAMESVGGFDERFFMYFEEVDLCFRLRERGWATHFAPVADVVHHGAASTSQQAAAMQLQYYESLARFHRYHHGERALLRMARIVRTAWAARSAWWSVRGALRLETHDRRSRHRGHSLAHAVREGSWAGPGQSDSGARPDAVPPAPGVVTGAPERP